MLTYAEILPEGRLADRLRAEQYRHFFGETWLDDHLTQDPGRRMAVPSAISAAPQYAREI